MRTKALALRILNQIRHDKRTVALIIFAPLLILTIIYFIFNASDITYKVGVIDMPDSYIEKLEDNDNAEIKTVELEEGEAREAVKNEDVTAAVDMSGNDAKLYVDGSNATDATKVVAAIKSSAMPEVPEGFGLSAPDWDEDYVYGQSDGSLFDNFGAALVGIIVFFLVFLIAGINFLTERSSGTLEKLLSTPIKRSEIVGGYTLGFSVLAIIQSLIVTFFVIYVLGLHAEGSIWYVILINLLTAVTALTLGMLLSTLANSQFQFVQFIPLVILPQIFLCGLFNLTGGWKIAGYFMPLYYTTESLKSVMIRGHGFADIWIDVLVLFGCAMLFMVLNILVLKKFRKI